MAVQSVTRTSSQITAQRIEVRYNVTMDDAAVHPILMHTAHKKHVVESYKNNDNYTPQVGQHVNHTIVRLKLDEFHAAFERYCDALAAAIQTDGFALQPKAAQYEFADATAGCYFHSDAVTLGANVHCFPSKPTVGSTTTASLAGQDFADLIQVLRFLWGAGDGLNVSNNAVVVGSNLSSDTAKATASYNRIKGNAWFTSLTTPLERAALGMKLKTTVKEFTAAKLTATKMVKQPATVPFTFKPG